MASQSYPLSNNFTEPRNTGRWSSQLPRYESSVWAGHDENYVVWPENAPWHSTCNGRKVMNPVGQHLGSCLLTVFVSKTCRIRLCTRGPLFLRLFWCAKTCSIGEEAGLVLLEAFGRWRKENKSGHDHCTYPELCTRGEVPLPTLSCGGQ